MDIQLQVVALQELADSVTKRCYVSGDTTILPEHQLKQLKKLADSGRGKRPDKLFQSQFQNWIAEDN